MNKSKKRNEILGHRFGKLIVEKFVGSDKRHNAICQCLCDCGNRKNILAYRLTCGVTKSCGCVKSLRLLRPYECLYRQLHITAKNTKRDIDITFEDFLKFVEVEKCHYCETEIKWEPFNHGGKNQGYHLDRKNNDVGYLKTNCVVCCRVCNFVKGNQFTYAEMKELGMSIKNILDSRRKV